MVDLGDGADDVAVTEPGDGFIYFRMTGKRFEEPGMPADSVIEVQRLSELLYQVARRVWLDRNDGRTRVPSEMVEAFDLRLVSVEEGSTMPVLRLPAPRPLAPGDEDFTPIFEIARDVVVESIAHAAEEADLPDDFPREALPWLRRFGKTIAGGEAIELAAPRPPSARRAKPQRLATLTPTVHETIKLIDAVLATEPSTQTIEGVITEFDGARGSFEIRDDDNQSHVCRLAYNEPELAERIKAALAADGVTAPDVRIFGTGVLDHRGRVGDLWDVVGVETVRSAEEKMLITQISALAELPADWWGPSSVAPDRDALRSVEVLLPDLARVGVPIAIGATGSGAVVLEWTRGPVEYTAQVEPGAAMFLCSDDTDTDALAEREGPFDARALLRFVQSGDLGE